MYNYTLEKAIFLSISVMERKIEKGLFQLGDETLYPTDDCDVETVYSLASLYSQFVEDCNQDEAYDVILTSLIEKLSNYKSLIVFSSDDKLKAYFPMKENGIQYLELFFETDVKEDEHPINSIYNWLNSNGYGNNNYLIQIIK
jgi:hypothetical protein